MIVQKGKKKKVHFKTLYLPTLFWYAFQWFQLTTEEAIKKKDLKCWENVKWLVSVNFGLILLYKCTYCQLSNVTGNQCLYCHIMSTFCWLCPHHALSKSFPRNFSLSSLCGAPNVPLFIRLSHCDLYVRLFSSRLVPYSWASYCPFVKRSRGYCPLLPGLVSCIYLHIENKLLFNLCCVDDYNYKVQISIIFCYYYLKIVFLVKF